MISTFPGEGANEIEKRQAMLAAIIDNSEDAIISKTLEGYITSWNQAAERMFGYKEEEVIGRHISLLIPPERLSEEDMIIENIRHGRRVQHFQTIRRTKSGGTLPISLSVSPIKDKDGVIIGASKIARDITEQIRLEEHNARLYEEIKLLNARKDEFIGIAGHELRTPITTIKGYLQLLGSEIPEGTGKEFTEKALRQVNKLNSLISDLLDVTKIQSGQLAYSLTRIPLRPFILEIVETVGQIYHTHSIESILPEEEIFVQVDNSKIEQVLINLLGNAVKYSPNAQKIILEVRKEEGKVIVCVRDFGIGISEEHLPHVFHRYYRGNADPVISGLGIGLYISKEIILRHSGDIWATSTPGEGSTFSFSLPARP